MNLRRIGAVIYARSLEFVRDRSALSWSLVMPVLMVVGLAFIFSGDGQPLFKVGVIADNVSAEAEPNPTLHPFLATQHIDFYSVPAEQQAAVVKKVGRHQVDMLMDLRANQLHYWVNTESPKGYFLELLLKGSDGPKLTQETVQGQQIRYVDWVIPGILGMNMMFSCLWGVGYVIVRYRKNGYLKRLNATPLTATEFLLGQIVSRMVLVVGVSTLVFTATNLFMHFVMEGSYLNLLIVLIVGTFTLITMGLLVASRVRSEELSDGLLNLLTWPMMLLSGVWFSMEGTNPVMQWLSQLSPLTHTLTAARAIMLDGASLLDVAPHLLILMAMSIVFLVVGALGFRWTTD
jgi:ABC-type multidrug transport system permease subunit